MLNVVRSILKKYYLTFKNIISAFNPAGEGPRSDPVSVKTLQGIPGPPANLKFGEITMNTLKVSWDPPVKPNGEILGYIVAYETAEQDESEYYSLQCVPEILNFCIKKNSQCAIAETYSCIFFPQWFVGNVTAI